MFRSGDDQAGARSRVAPRAAGYGAFEVWEEGIRMIREGGALVPAQPEKLLDVQVAVFDDSPDGRLAEVLAIHALRWQNHNRVFRQSELVSDAFLIAAATRGTLHRACDFAARRLDRTIIALCGDAGDDAPDVSPGFGMLRSADASAFRMALHLFLMLESLICFDWSDITARRRPISACSADATCGSRRWRRTTSRAWPADRRRWQAWRFSRRKWGCAKWTIWRTASATS